MKATHRLIGFVIGSCVFVGCSAVADDTPPLKEAQVKSSRRPIVLDKNASRAPQAVADQAIVEDGKITITASKTARDWVATLEKGTVIAGNREQTADLQASKNPYGFLRKVVSIREGDPIVITTERAYLPDLLEGDLHFGDDAAPSIFTDAKDGTKPQGVRPLANDEGASSGSGEGLFGGELSVTKGPIVKLTNGKITVDAAFSGDLKIRKWWEIPTGIDHAMAQLELNPSASVDIEVGAKGALAGSALDKTLEGPSIPIPLAGPIPVTLRVRPDVKCTASANGDITVLGSATVDGHLMTGFEYNGGLDLKALGDEPRLTPGYQLKGVQGKATITATCTVQASISLLAFDGLGIEGKFGPYVTLTGTLCGAANADGKTGGFTLTEEHGLNGNFDGRLQVPGLGHPSYNQSLFTFSPSLKSDLKYLAGSADMKCGVAAIAGCAGKADGLYCSETTPNSAYQCLAGQIAGGQQCGTGQKCAGTAGGTIQCR